MIWNVEDYNSPRSFLLKTQWEAQLRDIIWGLDDGQPRFKSERWQSVFTERDAEKLFHLPLGLQTWKADQRMSTSELESRIFTYCMLQNATPEKRESYKQRIQRILQDAVDGKKGGGLTMHSSVVAAWTFRA